MGKAAVEKSPAAETGIDAASVRNELLSMLNSAGQRPPAPAAPSQPKGAAAAVRPEPKPGRPANAPVVEENDEPQVDPNACAQCGSTEPWGTSNWCPKCGYYPALGHAGHVDETPREKDLSEFTLSDFLPRWLLTLLGGCVFILVGSALMEQSLAGNVGFLSLASLVQVSFGLLLMVFAHVMAYLNGIKLSPDVSMKDFLTNPPAVWMPVLKKLPETSHLLVNFSWGLTATVSALLIFGPIRMGAIKEELAKTEEKKPKKSVMGTLIGGVAAASGAANANSANQPQSLDEAVEAFAGIATESGGLSDIVENVNNGGSGELGDGTGLLDDGSGAGEGSGGEGGTTNSDGNDSNKAGEGDDAGTPNGTSSSSGGAQTSSGRDGSGSGSGRPTGSAQATATRTTGEANSSNGTTAVATPGPEKSVRGVIFGYLTNPSGELRSVLVAEGIDSGRPKFAGQLTSESFTAAQWSDLESQLPTLRTRRPLVGCPFGGSWVVPNYQIEFEFQNRAYSNFTGARVQSLSTK